MLDWKVKAEEHAKNEFPSEVCGLVVCIKGKEKYMPCKNLAMNPLDHFRYTSILGCPGRQRAGDKTK